MSSDSRAALRVGMIAAARAYAPLVAVVPAERIKTGTGQAGASKPYIRLGSFDGLAFEAKTGLDGLDGRAEVHCWSTKVGGEDGVEVIQDLINKALTINSISISGHSLVVWTLDFCDWFPLEDGDTYHGVQRFKFMTCGG